jgi:hypothetical protein
MAKIFSKSSFSKPSSPTFFCNSCGRMSIECTGRNHNICTDSLRIYLECSNCQYYMTIELSHQFLYYETDASVFKLIQSELDRVNHKPEDLDSLIDREWELAGME